MRIIIGLGNPGRKYTDTRHNIGFEVVERLAKQFVAEAPREKFESLTQEVVYEGEKLLLMRPLTFMNRSGRAARAARDFYKIENENVLVISDDFQLDLGKLRFRASGSAGGQNGLADVIVQLGTNEVPRLRLGIGPVPPQWSTVDFVLGRYDKQQREVADEAVQRAANGIKLWVTNGLLEAMNKYN